MNSNDLIDDLVAIVGAAHVATDRSSAAFAVRDLFPWPEPASATAVVKPASTDDAARVIARLHQARCPVLARGAGLSYTGGVATTEQAVVIDTTRLASIDIHADDLYAIVGAGCTWQALAEALAPHGLRAAQHNPISGAVSTVGGLASQSVPGGTDGMLGLTVVLADGTVVRTGAHARAGGSAFARNFGPDLTGLFLGDCGAFGVKTEVVLRLAPEPACAFASFSYDDAHLLVGDIVELQRHGLATRVMAMDQQRGVAAGRPDVDEAVRTIGATIAASGSVLRAVRDVAELARGRRSLARGAWSLHLTAESVDETSARARLAPAERLCAVHAVPIEPIVPRTLRAKPYSIRGFVGIDGERWVPVHGIVPLSQAVAVFAALETLFAAEAEAMGAAGITRSTLISSSGPYVTIEPMFYWVDALDALHLARLSERNRARFGGRPENGPAREHVARLRTAVRDVFDRHDAVHAQTGRFYRYTELMTPGATQLVARIKSALDPEGRMNPGVLGLGSAPAPASTRGRQ